MQGSRVASWLLSSLLAATSVSCGGGNLASDLAKPPEWKPHDQTQCAVVASHAKPLVVEWPSADRGELEARVRGQGLVVVEYSGCHMRVLDHCSAGAGYEYAPITKKTDHVVMRDKDDLYTNVPVGAAKLEAKLEKSGQLDVDMTMVGRWESRQPSVRGEQLRGACEGATHVLSAVTVGAFTFTAGADAEVGAEAKAFGAGGGGKSVAKRETLSSDGSKSACDKATMSDHAPPDECGALIRVEVVPLVASNPFVGRWTCTGTATLTDATGKAMSQALPSTARTVTDDGDGLITVVSDGPVPCPHKLRVSGSSATIAQPYTCQTDRATVTATSVTETVSGAALTIANTATAVIQGGARLSVVSMGTCSRLGP